MSEARVIVFGAAGRMGARVTWAAHEAGLRVFGALERERSPALGHDAGVIAGVGRIDVTMTDDRDGVLSRAREQGSTVAIEFTEPAASIDATAACAKAKIPIVIATTGHNAAQRARIAELAQEIPIVFAPNMSVGMSLLFAILPVVARTLGDDYDIEIVEAHHRHKKDAPSGTAMRLGEILATAMDWRLDEVARYERRGQTGERPRKQIGMQTLRAGDIVGDHTVYFATTGERIEITHRASSRDTFARGAVRAARWLVDRHPGLYDMLDVLGLSGGTAP
jgi:4-hydroxy-tetrahydrodipicolinate reductase